MYNITQIKKDIHWLMEQVKCLVKNQGNSSVIANQNNIFRSIHIPTIGEVSEAIVANYINSLAPFTISDIELLVITVIKTVKENSVTYKYLLCNTGKGTYGQGGFQLNNTNLTLIYEKELVTTDVEDLDTTQIIILGLLDIDIVNTLNNYTPPITIQNQADGYVLFKTSEGSYLFLAEGGLYGSGELQTTTIDFQSLAEDVLPITNTSQLINDGGTGVSVYTEKPYVDDIVAAEALLRANQDAATLISANTFSSNIGLQLINGAPEDANTLKELNDKIIAVQAIIGGTAPDGDSLVNTVAELLAVFATFPEGVNLVTLLAGKVNTIDVYNALDCIIAGKVADARQLKVLNDLILALSLVVSGKEPTITPDVVTKYWSGIKTWRDFATDVLTVGAVYLKKLSNTSHESLSDTSDVYSPTLFDRVGGIFRSNYLKWNETSRKLTIKGSQAIWEAWEDVTDGNMGIKALTGGIESFKIYDNISNFLSTGTETGKRVTRIFTELRLVNGVSFNATEFKTLDCLASVTTMLKTIAVPTDSILTIDIYNISIMNTAKNSIIGFAQFSFKNSSGTVTDISRDELRYGRQWSYIKAVPLYVINTDTRIDCSISGTNVSVNFVNTTALLTAVHSEIKYNITIIPVA